MHMLFESLSIQEQTLKIAQAQREALAQGQILCHGHEDLPLPSPWEVEQTDYRNGTYTCPFGTFTHTGELPGAYLFTPNQPGVLPPEWAAYDFDALLQPAVARLYRGRAVIRAEDGTEIILEDLQAANPEAVLDEANRFLAQQKIPLRVWQVWGTSLAEKDRRWPGLSFAGDVPLLHNQHMAVPVTGYAFDEEDGTLIYVGAAGYKTALESLRATLARSAASKRSASAMLGLGFKNLRPLPDKYESLYTPVEGFVAYHAAFLARQAAPGKWQPDDETAYALVFESDVHAEQDVQIVLAARFVARLTEILVEPVIPEWGSALQEAAEQAGHVSPLVCGGDCRAGVCIDLTQNWGAFLETLLMDGVLTIPENE